MNREILNFEGFDYSNASDRNFCFIKIVFTNLSCSNNKFEFLNYHCKNTIKEFIDILHSLYHASFEKSILIKDSNKEYSVCLTSNQLKASLIDKLTHDSIKIEIGNETYVRLAGNNFYFNPDMILRFIDVLKLKIS